MALLEVDDEVEAGELLLAARQVLHTVANHNHGEGHDDHGEDGKEGFQINILTTVAPVPPCCDRSQLVNWLHIFKLS